MLRQLSIRNVVLIESLDIDFSEGFSVLTGETGAGKSILLDALGFVLGERSDVNLIRKNCEQATVMAEFVYNYSFDELHVNNSIPVEKFLTLKRVLQLNGRSKAYINDEPVSANTLKLFANNLVEIHGQHDHLFSVYSQRLLVDQLLDKNIKNDLKLKFELFQNAKKKLSDFEENLSNNIYQQAFLKMQKEDLDLLKPKEKEESYLLDRREQIVGFAKIANVIKESLQAISYPKDLAQEIARYQQALEKANILNLKSLVDISQSLDRAYIEVKESQNAMHELLEQHQEHANELIEIDQRLSDLRSVAKKYNVLTDELYLIHLSLLEKIKDLENPDFEKQQLQKNIEESKIEYIKTAEVVSNNRLKIAERIETEVARELPDLFLSNSKFKISITRLAEDNWANFGFDNIIFEVSMNPGQPFSPLHKSASGGEMARLMLALKVAFMKSLSLCTIIFDEIDQGVSGAVALSIGKRLRQLGGMGQTIAVTHSPQVASQANNHFFVEKKQMEDSTITNVRLLLKSERLDEIGRMLSGDVITDAARNAAASLMNGEII